MPTPSPTPLPISARAWHTAARLFATPSYITPPAQIPPYLILLASFCAASLSHAGTVKPFPQGVYESAAGIRQGGDNIVARTPLIAGQDGILVRVGWDLCGDNLQCLLDTIELNLNTSQDLGLKVALAIADGDAAPPAVKSRCQLFHFIFRDEPASMCLPWDSNYLDDKSTLIQNLGQRFDNHPALAHMYFTAACSSNGFEGHCRVDQSQYVAAGYTPELFNNAYALILQRYLAAFATTPITFEVHSIFDRIDMWTTLWDIGQASGRVGIAAWWCAERLSLRGHDTVPVWPLVQQAAQQTYAVCQTVSNFTEQPYRFSDDQLPIALDYGVESDWDANDAENAFSETLAWVAGTAVHAGQDHTTPAFSAIEAWTQDMNTLTFQDRLAGYLDSDQIFSDSFEVEN